MSLRRALSVAIVSVMPLASFAAGEVYEPATSDAEMLPKAASSLLTDISSTGMGAVAIGERGHILVSSDLNIWRQVAAPTRSLLTNVFAIDSDVWAVGHEEVILHSTNGGNTWVRQHADPTALGPLLDIYFFDSKRGFAVGAEGIYFTTEDSGSNWKKQSITDLSEARAIVVATEEVDESLASSDLGLDETPPHLNAIVRSSQGLMIVGESGAIFRSTDEGASWTRLELNYNGSMFGAIVLDDDSVIVYGLNGHAFQTKDLGTTWEPLVTNTDASLMGGAAVPGARAVLVGARGAVLTKDPSSPALKAFNYSDGGALAGVLLRGEKEFVVVGENGVSVYQPKPVSTGK